MLLCSSLRQPLGDMCYLWLLFHELSFSLAPWYCLVFLLTASLAFQPPYQLFHVEMSPKSMTSGTLLKGRLCVQLSVNRCCLDSSAWAVLGPSGLTHPGWTDSASLICRSVLSYILECSFSPAPWNTHLFSYCVSLSTCVFLFLPVKFSPSFLLP